MSRLWEEQRAEKPPERSRNNFFAIPEPQLTNTLGRSLPSRVRAALGSADKYLRVHWSLLNTGERRGQGRGNYWRSRWRPWLRPPTSFRRRAATASAFPTRAPAPPHSHAPPSVTAPDSREKRHRLLSEVPLQVPLPLCLTTSALGHQHGRCGCLAKRLLIGCGGAASLRRPPRFPALPSSPPPPPLAPVPGAGGLIATWGRASAAGSRLPVLRRPGGRRRRLCPRPLRRGDRAPGKLEGFILCRCAKPGPAPPWPQCNWRTTSWSRPEAVAGAAAVPPQPRRLLLPEPPWRRQLQLRPAPATGWAPLSNFCCTGPTRSSWCWRTCKCRETHACSPAPPPFPAQPAWIDSHLPLPKGLLFSPFLWAT